VRGPDLHAELSFMRDLFYGLYLVSAEDIGLKPALAKDEPVDPERCYHLAADWLPKAFEDPDMAADTRVSVPVYVDPVGGVTRLWATLGVRLAKLDADFARPPHIRLQDGGGWKTAETYQLGPAHYLIPVDEFAEVELTGRKALSRDEFRAVCDREQTKEAIVAALQGGRFARTSPDDSETDWLWTGVAAAGVAVGLVVLYLVVRRLRAGG
jgi:hypothetical protein